MEAIVFLFFNKKKGASLMSEKKDIPDKELFPPGFEPGTFRV